MVGMDKKYLSWNDIEAYNIAYHLSNKVWEVVIVCNHFERNTIGQQFVRSVDSISANIAEGFGWFGKKDKIKFYRYASGSLYESLDWNEKAKSSKLLTQEEFSLLLLKLQ